MSRANTPATLCPWSDARRSIAGRRPRTFFRQKNWGAGLTLLDQIVGESMRPRRRRKKKKPKDPKALVVEAQDEFHARDGVLFQPVATSARQRLLELPDEARSIYQRTFQATAQRELQRALQLDARRGFAALERLAERYTLLEEGQTALEILVARRLDAGDAGPAASAAETLVQVTPPLDERRPTRLLSAALAHTVDGNSHRAARHLDELSSQHAQAVLQIGGQAVFAADVRSHARWRQIVEAFRNPSVDVPLLDWSLPGGRPSAIPLPIDDDALPELGGFVRWIQPVGGLLAKEKRTLGPRQFEASCLAVDDTIILRRLDARHNTTGAANQLLAVAADTGKLRWVSTGVDSQSHSFWSSHASHGLTSIVRMDDGSAQVLAVDQPTALNYLNNSRSYSANRLVAYNARNGKLLWSTILPSDGKKKDRRYAFTTAPVRTGETLVCTAIRDDGTFVVGLSLVGRLEWIRRLFVSGMWRRYVEGRPLSASGNIAVYADGAGLLSAIDGPSGKVLWQSRYRSRIRDGQTYRHVRSLGPSIVDDSIVVLTAPDSDFVTILDLHSGQRLAEWSIEDGFDGAVAIDNERIYLGGNGVLQAVRLGDQQVAWEKRMPIASPMASGFAARDTLVLPGDGNVILVIDSATGEVRRRLQVVDPRANSLTHQTLLVAGDTLVAASAYQVYGLQSQSELWKALGDADRPFRRADLLRAEGRSEEALEILYKVSDSPFGIERQAELRQRIVESVTHAAKHSEDPSLVAELLERERAREESETWPFLDKKHQVATLEALHIELLLKRLRANETPTENSTNLRPNLETLRDLLLRLSEAGGVRVDTLDDIQVDAQVYAADTLRWLEREHGLQFEPPAARVKKAQEILDHTPTHEKLVRLALTQRHLGAARDAAERLVEELAKDDPERAKDARHLLLESDRDRAATAADIPDRVRLPATHGLNELLRRAGIEDEIETGAEWQKVFWHSPEEGYLVATERRSKPLANVLAMQDDRLKVLTPGGDVLCERKLPEYPDVATAKMQLESHVEEPAAARVGDDRFTLFTAAGLYQFRYRDPTDASGAVEPNVLAVGWRKRYPHPLESHSNNSGFGGFMFGGIRARSAHNFFPQARFFEDEVAVVLPNGALFGVEENSGKFLWRFQTAGTTTVRGAPRRYGSWAYAVRGAPAGVQVCDRRSSEQHTFSGPSRNGMDVELVGGGLVALFSDRTRLEARLTSEPRVLWENRSAGRFAFATASTAWFSEPNGSLTARSILSGRVQTTVELPPGVRVLRAVPLAPGEGWFLLATANPYSYAGTIRGTGLHAIRLSARFEKTWEMELTRGTIVLADDAIQKVSEGRFLFALNVESKARDWHSKVLLIDATAADAGAHRELIGLEIRGKGTQLPPRLAVLPAGLAIGNTDGYGLFAPSSEKETIE